MILHNLHTNCIQITRICREKYDFRPLSCPDWRQAAAAAARRVDDAVGAEAFAGEASAASVAQARQIAADRCGGLIGWS